MHYAFLITTILFVSAVNAEETIPHVREAEASEDRFDKFMKRVTPLINRLIDNLDERPKPVAVRLVPRQPRVTIIMIHGESDPELLSRIMKALQPQPVEPEIRGSKAHLLHPEMRMPSPESEPLMVPLPDFLKPGSKAHLLDSELRKPGSKEYLLDPEVFPFPEDKPKGKKKKKTERRRTDRPPLTYVASR